MFNQDDNQANELINQQIKQNNVELEQKRQSITQERFSLVKSQGAQNWSPTPISTARDNAPRSY